MKFETLVWLSVVFFKIVISSYHKGSSHHMMSHNILTLLDHSGFSDWFVDHSNKVYVFRPDRKEVRKLAAEDILETTSSLLSHNEHFLSVSISFLPHKSNHLRVHTLLSLVHQKSILLQVEAVEGGATDRLVVRYTSGGVPVFETIYAPIFDQKWHIVHITFTPHAQLSVITDCEQVFKRQLYPMDVLKPQLFSTESKKTRQSSSKLSSHHRKVPFHRAKSKRRRKYYLKNNAFKRNHKKNLQGYFEIYVARNKDSYNHYQGLMDRLTITFSPSPLQAVQCPQLNYECPSCHQFAALEQSLQQLTSSVHHLSNKMRVKERRILELEEQLKFLAFKMADPCNRVQCDDVPCSNHFIPPNQCCPVCPRDCVYLGRSYRHNSSFIHDCSLCTCWDGGTKCKRSNSTCGPLICDPRYVQVSPSQCCPICLEPCHKRRCGQHSHCVVSHDRPLCVCDSGYEGPEGGCRDIDECLVEGGYKGHTCPYNSICTNTPGSYDCSCISGYKMTPSFKCEKIDPCVGDGSIESPGCHRYASCHYKRSEKYCQCDAGYQGDGFHCEPVCRLGCLGSCVAPDMCLCPLGFTDLDCMKDIDECLASPCKGHSYCVNYHGGFACRCLPGFYSPNLDNNLGSLCTPVSNLYSDIKQFRAKYLSTINPNICGLIPGDYGEAHTNITVINNTELCDGALVDNYLSANDKRSCHGSIHHSSSWVEGCEQCRCWNGSVICEKVKCPPLNNCKQISYPSHPPYNPSHSPTNHCCPRCLDHAHYCLDLYRNNTHRRRHRHRYMSDDKIIVDANYNLHLPFRHHHHRRDYGQNYNNNDNNNNNSGNYRNIENNIDDKSNNDNIYKNESDIFIKNNDTNKDNNKNNNNNNNQIINNNFYNNNKIKNIIHYNYNSHNNNNINNNNKISEKSYARHKAPNDGGFSDHLWHVQCDFHNSACQCCFTEGTNVCCVQNQSCSRNSN